MPLRTLFRYLANNEHLVQKIAESYPVRRAAQLAVSVFFRGKEKLSEMNPEKVNRLVSFYRKFSQNLREASFISQKTIKISSYTRKITIQWY
ncbi:jg26681 [Pararge aegeria aegeria]|uniref:Jg26681 protein n=1 Tax=Pararge aegeria aegeria TaxID=348720 RepID=A0A8S4RU65_9NEOP|nr:jg26681 [Pararge aegeria aegeria]